MESIVWMVRNVVDTRILCNKLYQKFSKKYWDFNLEESSPHPSTISDQSLIPFSLPLHPHKFPYIVLDHFQQILNANSPMFSVIEGNSLSGQWTEEPKDTTQVDLKCYWKDFMIVICWTFIAWTGSICRYMGFPFFKGKFIVHSFCLVHVFFRTMMGRRGKRFGRLKSHMLVVLVGHYFCVLGELDIW